MLLFARVAGIDRFVKSQHPSLSNTWLRILRVSNADSFLRARCELVDVKFTLDELDSDSSAGATGNDAVRGWLQRLDGVSDAEFSAPTALHNPRAWMQYALDQVRCELAFLTAKEEQQGGGGLHAADGSIVTHFARQQQAQQSVGRDDEKQSLIAQPYCPAGSRRSVR